MKRVLILAYDFPPFISVGGLRPYNWYLDFKKSGLEPIVVTRQWSNEYGNEKDYIAPSHKSETIIERTEYGTILKAPFKPNLSNRLLLRFGPKKLVLLRKALTAYFEIAQFFLPIGNKRTLLKSADDYLKNYPIDLIIATGEPFVLFHYAKKLSKKHGVSWVADYRDPWSQNISYKRNPLIKSIFTYLEKKIVKSAVHITTVSHHVQDEIEKVVPNTSISIIHNGYNPQSFVDTGLVQQESRILTISFVGSFYSWHPLEIFLKCASEFLKSQSEFDLKINFYGTNDIDRIMSFTKTHPTLNNSVHIVPKMENALLMKELAKSNLMLLFNYYSFMGTKIYDYLAIKRQILFCFDNDSEAKELKKKYYHLADIKNSNNRLQAELIENCHAGVIVQDQSHLMTVFNHMAKELKHAGKIACSSINVEQYSRTVQNEKLAKLLLAIPTI